MHAARSHIIDIQNQPARSCWTPKFHSAAYGGLICENEALAESGFDGLNCESVDCGLLKFCTATSGFLRKRKWLRDASAKDWRRPG